MSHEIKTVFLNVIDGTYVPSKLSAQLLHEIGGSHTILKIVSSFYEKFFKDSHIAPFVSNEKDPHAERLANWIVEKMGGEGTPWTDERKIRAQVLKPVILGDGRSHVVHDRTSAHHAAWFSPKRSDDEIGQRFKLIDTRIWMRLMFWAARESGVFTYSPAFAQWFVLFIAHFIRVYERSAPPYALESFEWSESSDNIEKYLQKDCKMSDLGL